MIISSKIIRSNPYTVKEYWRELIHYKGLILVFTEQEVSAMYAQTYLGFFWTVIRPLFTLGVFTIIFRFFLHVPTVVPYYLFAFTGMIAWNLFSQIALNASTAVAQKQDIIRRMYFPKLILPLAKIIVALIETGVSIIMMGIFLYIENIHIGINLFFLPLFILLNIACGLAIAIWMNALNIQHRDLNQILSTVIGIGVWITPVFYPVTIIPKGYEFMALINPMAGVIRGYRYAILGEPFPEQAYWWTMILVLVVMLIGIRYFIKKEGEMVDYI